MHTFFPGKCRALINILLLLGSYQLFAQHKPYTLSDLADEAKTHLPVIFQKNALINSAEAVVTDIRHSFLPRLRAIDQLNIGTDNSIAGSYFPLGIIPSTSAGVRSENNSQLASGNIAVLYGEYELVNFGLHSARIKNAQAYVDVENADLQKELYYIKLQVAQLYFNLLKNESILVTDGQNIDRYESIFKIIQALTRSGIKAGSDSSLAKAELSRTRITYNQTLGTINQLKEQLSFLTGIKASEIIIDTATLRHVMIQSDPFNQSVDTGNNPLINYYIKRRNVLVTNEKLIRKSFLPKIVLEGSTWARGSSIAFNDNYKSLGTGLGYQRFNYAAGIAIGYDLFNGIYKKDKLNINRFETAASEYELQQQRLVVNSAALQADHAIKTAETNLLEIPVQIDAAQNGYDQKLAQYKAGIINLVDLTNAAFVLYRSLNDYIETLSDWYLAQLDKAAAAGNLDNFIQTIK